MVDTEEAPPVALGDEVKPYRIHVSFASCARHGRLLTPPAGLEQIPRTDEAEAGADSSPPREHTASVRGLVGAQAPGGTAHRLLVSGVLLVGVSCRVYTVMVT
jgi:hypothetical protein